MAYEITMHNDISSKEFLLFLLAVYPYDIEQKLVLTLLHEHPQANASLLRFLEYFAHYPKFHLITKTAKKNTLSSLFTNMSLAFQTNKTNLHTHLFQFDATIFMKQYPIKTPYAHLPLDQIPFLDKLHLHTVPILPMSASYQPLPIIKSQHFLYRNLSIDAQNFFAVSIRICDKNGIVYVPKDQLRIGVALASLYEITPPSAKIDFYLLYGIAHQETTYAYYYDKTNDVYIGLISGSSTLHHFAYLKDMITTLYNSLCIEKHDLPVHGSMLQLHCHEKTIGLLLIGESGTGKSEIMDALTYVCDKNRITYTKVFDDSGILHYLDNDVYATGTQIGAYVSIDDLPKQHVYENLASSVFLKVDKQTTHILLPYTTFTQTCKFHKVDGMIYLNNYEKKKGIQHLHDLKEAKELFKNGCYRTKLHKLQTSFFCNPYGCIQQQDTLEPLIDDFLNLMLINNKKLAILYTRPLHCSKDTLYTRLAKILLKEVLEW